MKANVTYWLDRTAELYPNKTAFADAKKSVTFDQMRKQALRIATELTRRNLFKKPVAVFLEKGVDVLVSFMGAAYSLASACRQCLGMLSCAGLRILL